VRGLTLVELLLGLSLVALLAGAALPAWEGARQRRAVEGTAAELQAWLQEARALVLARREGAWLGLGRAPDGGPCLVLHGGARAGDCRCEPARAVCEGDLRAWRHLARAGSGVRLNANVAAMRLEPRRGQVVPAGTLRLSSEDARIELRLVVNPQGRVRVCAAAGLTGWPACA
jgi:Tfp pilus assembly protein FimT